MAKLNLLPAPRSVRQGKGFFKLADGLPAIVAPGEGREVNAAWSFAAEAEQKAGVRVAVERMGKFDRLGRRVLFLIAGRDEKLHPPLAKLARGLAKAPRNVRDQAYVIKVGKDEVLAAATSARGLYYAAQTLRQLVSTAGVIPCVTITDWPTYPSRGVMLDISRYKVPTLETLAMRVERLASMKINVFQLYTEHTFTYERHPDIGRNCGSMTAEDIIELDEFCKEHFIDLQANLQSFGHQDLLLSIPKYNRLAEVPEKPWTLAPVKPGTYKLLDDMYSECLPAYSSKLFNASCDETWDLGKGRSKARAKKIGVGRVYLEHIKKINKLAHKYGKRMMIWADIILKHPELIPEVPRDIIMLAWGYSPGQDLRHLAAFPKARVEYWVCPGVNTWNRIFANFETASRNIAERAEMGRRTGATGLLNTDWGDGGHPQTPSASVEGYAWGADQSWTPNPGADRADFERRFAWAWFGDDSGLFGRLYKEIGLTISPPSPRGEYPFRPYSAYWDRFPCTGSLAHFDAAAARRIRSHTRKALALIPKLSKTCPEHDDTLVEVLFGLRQMLFVLKKAAASQEVNDLRARGVRKLPASLRKTVCELLDEWNVHAQDFEALWMLKNRRSQIDFRLKLYKDRARDYRKLF